MIGKKNVVFGFLYLVLTAALGPVMIVKYMPDESKAGAVKQEKIGALQQAAASGYEVNLEKMTPEQIAIASADAVLALSTSLNASAPLDAIKSGPHTHGNLEALLNIAVGLTLTFLAIAPAFKQIISWIFILGALGHSGLLYLSAPLNLPWAQAALGSWIGYIGPSLILLGLALMGLAAAIGFRGPGGISNATRY